MRSKSREALRDAVGLPPAVKCCTDRSCDAGTIPAGRWRENGPVGGVSKCYDLYIQ